MNVKMKEMRPLNNPKYNCFAFRGGSCLATTKETCDACRFFKTVEKQEMGVAKAAARLDKIGFVPRTSH